MNAYERVMNTLQGLPVDRVPVFAVLSTYGGKLTGTDLHTLYSDASAYVAGQCAVQDTFGLDLVLAPFDYSAIAEAFGGEVAWFNDQAPNMRRPAARTAAEALALPLPDPQHTDRLPVSLEAVRKLAAIYQGRVPVFAAMPGPGALPALVLGLETWMETVLFDEPAARQVLNWSGQFFVAWANALMEAGATGLVITESVAAAEIMPRRLFAERFLPHLHAQFGQVRGPLVLHHTGGRIAQNLDLLPGLPGLIGVVIGSKDDLGTARQALGPNPVLIGNLDNLSLPTATPAEIHAHSLACLRTAAPAGRYILSHSGADIPLSTPPENIRAMLEASVEYASSVAAVILPAVAGGIPAAPASPAARASAAPADPAARTSAAPASPAARTSAAPASPAARTSAAPASPAARASAAPADPAARTDTAGSRPRRQAQTPAATTTPSIPATLPSPLTDGFHFRGRLPHLKHENAAYFVTFRLADSLPAERVRQFIHERESLLAEALAHQRPLSWHEEQQLMALYSDRMDRLLDAGQGSCCLRQAAIGELIATALKFFDGQRYDLRAWVVMPNHVHAIVWPYPGHSLSEILHSWKSYTAKQANRILGRQHEAFWETESYDHWIRNDREHARFVAYIEANPVKAGLCARPEDWRWSSATTATAIPSAVAGGVPAAPASPAARASAAPADPAARTDTAGSRPLRQAQTPAATTTPSIPAASATPTQLDPAIPAGSRPLRQAQTPAAPAATVWLCCGVLKAELEALHRQGRLGGELRFLDSMLHMAPQQLQATLTSALGHPGPAGGRLVLVYGDCCSRMLDLVREYRVGRVNAINCVQMLVGRARYRELMHAQAFMLLPEWALRWKEIMRSELGLSSAVARELMTENRSEIVYLDTGLAPVPCAALKECAVYAGLPYRVETVTLDHLLALLLEAESAAQVHPLPEEPS